MCVSKRLYFLLETCSAIVFAPSRWGNGAAPGAVVEQKIGKQDCPDAWYVLREMTPHSSKSFSTLAYHYIGHFKNLSESAIKTVKIS